MTPMERLEAELLNAKKIVDEASDAWYEKPTKRRRAELDVDEKWLTYLRIRNKYMAAVGILPHEEHR